MRGWETQAPLSLRSLPCLTGQQDPSTAASGWQGRWARGGWTCLKGADTVRSFSIDAAWKESSVLTLLFKVSSHKLDMVISVCENYQVSQTKCGWVSSAHRSPI